MRVETDAVLVVFWRWAEMALCTSWYLVLVVVLCIIAEWKEQHKNFAVK